MSYSNEFWRVTGDTSAWHAVAHLGTPARYPKGTVLLDAGKGTGNLYLLEGGQVRMIRTNRDGTERMLMSLEPGSTFGETPLFYDQPC